MLNRAKEAAGVKTFEKRRISTAEVKEAADHGDLRGEDAYFCNYAVGGALMSFFRNGNHCISFATWSSWCQVYYEGFQHSYYLVSHCLNANIFQVQACSCGGFQSCALK